MSWNLQFAAATLVALCASGQAVAAACTAPVHGKTALFMRGSMNAFGVFNGQQLHWQCDAYYANVAVNGTHQFKIADASWKPLTTYGLDPAAPVSQDGALAAVASSPANFTATFKGSGSIRLAFPDGRAQLTISALARPDPAAVAPGERIAHSLSHDTRAVADKRPFGSIAAGQEIAFALNALPGVDAVTLVVERRTLEGNQEQLSYHASARVPMSPRRAGARVTWSAQHRFGAPHIYGYYFEVKIGERTFHYQNNTSTIHWTRELGANGKGSVAQALPGVEPRRFRQTVHAPGFSVPAWARDAVYYYIFPERFRNGERSNDPRPQSATYQQQPIELHANWLEQPFRPGSGDGSDKLPNNDFFGGDLQGIIDKLDYILELGANTLYLTPVFVASSNHKYDTGDYRNIDPHFGSNADYTRLAAAAHQRGMRVIADASFNHSGADSAYFDRYARHAPGGAFRGERINATSPYASWYAFNPKGATPDQQYTGWAGVSDLPELNKASPSWRSFAYGADDSVTSLWLRRGADGWRMDVAPWVSDDFWRNWRKAVKAERPDALTIAETWFDSSKYFLGDTFDSTMNYIFRNAVLDYAGGADAVTAYQNLELMREAYPQPAFYALMNLLSTHDQARSLHVLGDHGPGTDPAAVALAKRRFGLAVFFQMMFPGAPAVYYGDEAGLNGGDDPANRATYPWADQGGKPDLEMGKLFKELIGMRAKHKVLRHGSIDAPLFIDQNVIVLARRDGATWAICAVNNSTTARTVRVRLPAGARGLRFANALNGTTAAAKDGGVTLSVPALFGTVLIGSPNM